MLTIQQNRLEEQDTLLATDSAIDLRFPGGLLGFENIKHYKLHAFPDLHPYLWLEGQDGTDQCFLVVPPSFVVDGYQIDISEDDVKFLGLRSPDDAVVLNVATFYPDGSITVNLKGPIIYNKHELIARQVVPKNAPDLAIKHPLGN